MDKKIPFSSMWLNVASPYSWSKSFSTVMSFSARGLHIRSHNETNKAFFLRALAVIVCISLFSAFLIAQRGDAYDATWSQTNWDGGVGSSTSSQYDSATEINSSTNGEFSLDKREGFTNTSFNSNISDWSTDQSQIVPAVVNTSIKAHATNTSHSLTYTKVPDIGNVLVAVVSYNSNPGTVTPPAGWVLDAESRINNAANLGRVAIYHKVVQSGDPASFTITNSVSAAMNFSIRELTGVNTTTPVDVTSTVNSGPTATTTTPIPNTSMTTQSSALAIAGVVYENATTYSSWTNSFINAATVYTYGYSGDKTLDSKQQVSTTFTGTIARRNAGALVVFKGATTQHTNTITPGVIQADTYNSWRAHAVILNSQPQVGNTLIAAVSHHTNPGDIYMPPGWTEDVTISNTSSLSRCSVYHKVVGPDEPRNFHIRTTGGAVVSYSLQEVSNIDTSSPLDHTSTYQSGTTNTTSAPLPATPTTTNTNSFAQACVAMVSASTTPSWTNGFTIDNTITDYGYAASKIITTSETVSTTFNGATSNRKAATLAVYKATATPTIVQKKDHTYGQGTALVAMFPTAIRENNTLFFTFNTQGNVGTITTPAGWTQIASAESASGRGTYLYSKIAGANEPRYQYFGLQYSSNGYLETYEVRGLSTTNGFDKVSEFENVNSNPLPVTLSAPTQNNAFVIGGMGTNSSSGFPTSWVSNGFTIINGSPGAEFQSAYKLQTTTAPYNLSFTNASARIAQGYLAAFNVTPNYISATHSTTTKYSGAGAIHVGASPWTTGHLTQSINLGDTDTYSLTAKVYDSGGAVGSDQAQLFYNDSPVSTTYTNLGSGWWELSSTIVGENLSRNIGIEIGAAEDLYVDDLSIERYEATGTLTSNIFDTGRLSNWGITTFSSSGLGTVSVKARSSNAPDMFGAPNFSTCAAITSGADISTGTNGCVTDAERYIQYQVILNRGPSSTPTFEEIEISYRGSDETTPDTNASNIAMYKSNGGDAVSLNDWTNGNAPYFTWDAGVDNAGGIGIAGYCVYLGTDNSADPITTKGMLGTGDLDVRGACPFATANEYLDLGTIGNLASALTTSSTPYYILIKAIDANDNIFSGSAASFHFRYDDTAPTNPSYVTAPSNFISTKTATLTWETSNGDAPSDGHSGVAGLQYKIGASGTWYGDSHTGDQDFDDLLTNDGDYTTQNVPDFANLVEGNNILYFRTWDQAGNVTIGSTTTVLKINTAGSPSPPQNVTATPTTNTINEFSFNWLTPATYVGNGNNITYCYTVNVAPTVNNCTYTAPGVLSVPAGAFASQPGVNTFYVVARDESNSINYASYATAEFTANTAAPGIPLNLDIADTSVRTTSNWRLVVSWEPPDDVGAGVNSYQVFRSSDGVNFTKVGSTGGTSYVDSGLSQVDYTYKIKACDSANNCGANSSTVTMLPTGRYTSPALITSSGGLAVVSNIQTRSVDISWSTDRNSDSKIAFGTSPGEYAPTEAYSSQQTTDHRISLTNLTPGTTYFFVARWTDTDGNTGTTTEQVFITLPPPLVEDVSAIGIGLDRATIQYTTTGAAAVKVYYGLTNGFGAVVESATSTTRSTYLAQLSNLTDGTKYFYKVNTFDASGYEYEGTTITFETPPAPKISNLRFQPVEGEPSSTQKVSWETNVPASSELSYGRLDGETLTYLDTSLKTVHEVVIADLTDDSTYKLVARSRDASANLAVSDEQTFRTALDTRPPHVSSVSVISSISGTGIEARGQVIISWKTDEPATSQVAYGEGTTDDLNNTSTIDQRLTFDHSVIISDLSTSKVYSLKALSTDKGSNVAESDVQTAIVGRASESALGIIFSVLQKIFGVHI